MARNILLITIMASLVHENMPLADPQLSSPYYQPGFSSYYQHVPAPYHQQAVAPYYQPYLAPYYPQEPLDYRYGPLAGYDEEDNRNAYIFGPRVCPMALTIFPCICSRKNLLFGAPFGAIVCPPGQTAAKIQIILAGIPAGLNIQSVTLNLSKGTNIANSVPAAFTTNYPAAAISIVHPLITTGCIDSSLLDPCTCFLDITICPAGTTIAQIQAIYNKIAPNTNLGIVMLNFPAGATTTIPANLLGTNSANKIELIGPAGNIRSQLTIPAGAFTSSARTATQFWIENFDVVNVDYSFLANFNQLTTLKIDQCSNPPTVVNQLKNLPANLPQLTTVSVDGVNIKQIVEKVCPPALEIFPCVCSRKQPLAGAAFGSIICPPGQTASKIQVILAGIPAGLNIQSVTLNLSKGTNIANSVPASFTTNYPAAAISIVHPLITTDCIDSSLLAPCTCFLDITTCPAGTTIAQIQAVYNKIAPNTNLGIVMLNFPAGATTTIPANLLGTNSANKIELIGPAGNIRSQLTISAGAFSSSARTATQFWIENFDVVNVDYSFLANFNQLTTLKINQCSNPPTAVNQLKNLPANLPQLTTVSVDGVNIKQIVGKVCPPALEILPCVCSRKQPLAGAAFGSIICPPGQTASKIQIILAGIPAGLNIQSVTLNLSKGTNIANSVPASFTTNYPAAAISIVHPLTTTDCIDSSLLAPCTCFLDITICPAGTTIAQIQAIYNKIAPNTNLGIVMLNFPAGATTTIPANLLGTNSANKIELIGPAGNIRSQLTIPAGAFTSSARTATQFWIENFDVVNVDYSFLANFNVLTTLKIDQCSNPPTVANQPRNLPANLPQLTTISVDGVNIKANGR